MAKLVISKFDAGRRQLETAIDLWFHDRDPVSVHTLACAAYEVIYYISKIRNPSRRDLLLDTVMIKDEYRIQFIKKMKAPANFFKHAKEDGEITIEFNPDVTEGFVLFSILGVQLSGERLNLSERAWSWWMEIHHPELLTAEGKEILTRQIPGNGLTHLRNFQKADFFQQFKRVAIALS